MTKAKSDSIVHHEERLAKMQGESRLQAGIDAVLEEERREQQAVHERSATRAEEKFLNDQAALLPAGTTRDQLLDRIRQMREEVPSNAPPPPPPMTDGQRQQLNAEQEAGRAAVLRAEQDLERARQAREKAVAEQRAREGHMETVHHPNPGQDEQFPASKATLGKRK